MKREIAIAATLFATSLVSVGSALASPANVTVSGAPAFWRSNQVQRNSVQLPEAKPVDVRDKQEAKPIAEQPPAMTSTGFKCTGDARFSKPPVPNYPQNLRNVMWRILRQNCVR